MPDVIQIAIQATDAASKVIGVVGDSLDKLGKQSEDAEKKIKLFGLSTEQIGAKMTQAGKIATVGLTLPIAGLAVAATKAASDLNETSNKIQTLFGNATDAVMEFSKTAATSLGQSQKQALDAAADFAVFGKAAGLAGNDLVDFSEKNVKLAADMASFFNTSPEEAIIAIGAAFRGESEPIRRYGVLINEASLKDQALRLGLIKTTTEALQPQARVLAAQALILQQTSAAQGDFERTSAGLANQSRILNAQFQDTIAALGQSLLPIAVQVTGAANDLLKAFNNLDQPTKDLIVGFGLMAAAAGPVLTIGGKLVGVFGSIGSVAIDAAGGFITLTKDVGDTAKYLKEAGVSVDTLKFAFQNLKAGGAILGVELGVIAAGLIAVIKFIEAAGVAASATTDELLKMAHSGDFFKQAGASFEIIVNGQSRLNVAVRDVNTNLKTTARTYDEYISGVLGAAVAAGTLTKAQADEFIATGKVTEGWNHQYDITQYIIDQTGILTRDKFTFAQATKKQSDGIDILNNAMLRGGEISERVNAQNQQLSDGLKALAEARTRTGDAEKAYQDEVKKTMDVIKAQNSAISDAYNMAIQYTESQRKQSDVQKELDTLNDKIAARGPVHTALVKNEKLSAEELTRAQLELKVAQEDLMTVQRKGGETDAEFALRVDALKGKVADYSAKLGEHTAVVGGATKAELEQKTALEGQIAALQKADEVTRAKGAFDSLTKAFREGVITQDQFKERAGALNAITGLYTQSALAQATAQEVLMQAFADPRSEAWRSQLILNKDAIDGVTGSTDKATEATKKLKEEAAKPVKAETKAEKVELPSAGKSIDAAQRALDFTRANEAAAISAKKAIEDVSIAQESASREMKGHIDEVAGSYKNIPKEITTVIKPKLEVDPKIKKDLTDEFKYGGQPIIAPKVDTVQATKDIQSFATDVFGVVPAEKKTTLTVDTNQAVMGTLKVMTLFGLLPRSKDTAVNVDAKFAIQTLDDVLRRYEKIKDKSVTVEVKYTTSGTPPEGFQHGGSMIIPPNPSGSLGDYFPVLAAPGERVTVQTRAQQGAERADLRPISGDTYNYVTNVYNPLAAAMLADQQRRERLSRSNARMGVQ